MLQPKSRFAVWAPTSQNLDLPLSVRSVGRYRLNSEWSEKQKKKWFVQLFWTVDGEGEFQADGTSYTVKPGDIFIYRPGDVHALQPISQLWVYCWITWSHPESLRWVEAFGLKGRVHHREPCPQWLFEEVADCVREHVSEGLRRAAHLSHAILLEASIHRGRGLRKSPAAERARKYLDAECQDITLTMESLADRLHMHRTSLFRTFQNAYGLSPSLYLHNRRMERALGLLYRSNLPIKEVAARAGFSDPNYFSRVVKKATGMTPKEFRMSGG